MLTWLLALSLDVINKFHNFFSPIHITSKSLSLLLVTALTFQITNKFVYHMVQISTLSRFSKELSPFTLFTIKMVVWSMMFLLLLLFSVIINGSSDERRNLIRSINLNERMFMFQSFFANFTKIKVNANTTFISNTNYWAYSTTVASNIRVGNNLRLLLRFVIAAFTQFFAFHQLFKKSRCNLIQFSTNQLLYSLSWR